MSETSKCRTRLAPYCTGAGVDLGCGGDLIVPSAIGVDLPKPYTKVGDKCVHLHGDAQHLLWFNDETLDFVFSSHLLEDFSDTKAVILEWLRVLRIGGLLVLFLPDEQVYRKHCHKTGQPYNTAHSVEGMSLAYIDSILSDIGVTVGVHKNALVDTYSFELVARKVKSCSRSLMFQSSAHAMALQKADAVEQIRRSITFRIGRAIMTMARYAGLVALVRMILTGCRKTSTQPHQ